MITDSLRPIELFASVGVLRLIYAVKLHTHTTN